MEITFDDAAIKAMARDPQVRLAMDRLGSRVLLKMKKDAPVSKVYPVYATKGRTVPGGVRYAGDFPLRPSGYMRNSCRKWRMVDGSIIVGPTAPYGRYVNDGTPPHPIDSTGPWPLRNRATGQVFGRHVNHPGTRAVPFITNSLDAIAGARVSA